MDKKFDYSEYELGKLTYSFADLTPAEADEKRTLYEQFVREKEAAKLAQAMAKAATATGESRRPEESGSAETPVVPPAAKRPLFRPTAKPAAKSTELITLETPETVPDSTDETTAHLLPNGTPNKMQPVAPGEPEVQKRPAFMPIRKPTKLADPVLPTASASEPDPAPAVSDPETPAPPKPRPAFRPTMKPKPALSINNTDEISPDTSA